MTINAGTASVERQDRFGQQPARPGVWFRLAGSHSATASFDLTVRQNACLFPRPQVNDGGARCRALS